MIFSDHFAVLPGRHTVIALEKGIEIVFVGKAASLADLPDRKRGVGEKRFDITDPFAPDVDGGRNSLNAPEQAIKLLPSSKILIYDG